jgi:hypothetical protein
MGFSSDIGFESGALPPLPQTDYERAAERREHERECAGGNGFELRLRKTGPAPSFIAVLLTTPTAIAAAATAAERWASEADGSNACEHAGREHDERGDFFAALLPSTRP